MQKEDYKNLNKHKSFINYFFVLGD